MTSEMVVHAPSHSSSPLRSLPRVSLEEGEKTASRPNEFRRRARRHAPEQLPVSPLVERRASISVLRLERVPSVVHRQSLDVARADANAEEEDRPSPRPHADLLAHLVARPARPSFRHARSPLHALRPDSVDLRGRTPSLDARHAQIRRGDAANDDDEEIPTLPPPSPSNTTN